MIIDYKEYILKNGKKMIIKTPELSDAKELLEVLKQTYKETEYLSKYEEEVLLTDDDELKYIETQRNSQYGYMIICIVDDKIVGHGHIAFNRLIKSKHDCTIGLAIIKEYWNLGIGGMMLDLFEDLAYKHKVERISLSLLEGNQNAQRLYEKKGYHITGVEYQKYKLKNGMYQNSYHMIKPLDYKDL